MAVLNKRSHRRLVGGSAPVEPECGHSSCGETCNVRYVGPTSHIRDHHILHAAQGVAHVWTAAIVSGLAVVITGAFAFQAVDAATVKKGNNTNNSAAQAETLKQLKAVNERLDTMDALLKKLNDQCTLSAAANSSDGGDSGDVTSSDEAQ